MATRVRGLIISFLEEHALIAAPLGWETLEKLTLAAFDQGNIEVADVSTIFDAYACS